MTQASIRAMEGMRDLTSLQWYVIPLLAIVFYVYATEIKRARRKGNWDAIFAGLTLFGMDFINETLNGYILVLSGKSALWTAPARSALKTMVGWNIEIMFMFLLSGIIYYNSLSRKRNLKILGLPEEWALAIGYSVFCVVVEILLNMGGLLIWEYPFWNRSFAGVWLIFLFGYFHFYVAIILVLKLKKDRYKIAAVGSLFLIGILLNYFGMGIMGWNY